jgi:hypothetical protein
MRKSPSVRSPPYYVTRNVLRWQTRMVEPRGKNEIEGIKRAEK